VSLIDENVEEIDYERCARSDIVSVTGMSVQRFRMKGILAELNRQELRDGYVKLMNDLYEPEAYFGRLEDLYLKGRLAYGKARAAYLLQHPWAWLKAQAASLVTSVVLFRRLMRGIPEATLRQEYRKRVWRLLRVRPKPSLLLLYIYRCAMHYHQYTMTRQMTLGHSPIYNSF
jgi:hypothetical protein